MCKWKFWFMLQVTLPTVSCSKHAVEENHMETPNYEPNSTCPVHSLTLYQLPACSTVTYTVIFWSLPGGSKMWERRSANCQGTGKAVSLFQAILNSKYITQILPRKVQLSQCLIKHHATTEHRGVNPLFHTFLPSVIDGGVSGQFPAPASLPPSPPLHTRPMLHYPMNMRRGLRASCQFQCFTEKSLVLLGIKPEILSHPCHSLVNMLTIQSWPLIFTYMDYNILFKYILISLIFTD
jgi:hypothetical protein